MVTPPPTFDNLVNFEFPGFLGGAAPNPSGTFTNGYFSPDGSFFVLVAPKGSGTTSATAAWLDDIARGAQIGATNFFTAAIVSVVLTGNQVAINTNPALSRRQLLAGLAAAPVAALLTGCRPGSACDTPSVNGIDWVPDVVHPVAWEAASLGSPSSCWASPARASSWPTPT